MDGLNINGMIQGILDNPQMMQSLMGLIGNLKTNIPDMNQADTTTDTDTTQKKEEDITSVISQLKENREDKQFRSSSHSPCASDRKALLLALRPFMGKDRQDKIDFILNILSLLDVAESLGFTNLKI